MSESVLRGLTAWKERACEIAQDIKYRDLRDLTVYLVRNAINSPVSDDLDRWHPEHQDPYPDELPLINGVDFLSYDYWDDRTVVLLLESGVLDKEKTEAYPVSDYRKATLGRIATKSPAGYASFPNWNAIDSKSTTFQELLKANPGNEIEHKITHGYSFLISEGIPQLLYAGKEVMRFRSTNRKGYIYLKHCFENINQYIPLKTVYELYKSETGSSIDYPLMVSKFNKNIVKTIKRLVGKVNAKADKAPYKLLVNFENSAVRLQIVKR